MGKSDVRYRVLWKEEVVGDNLKEDEVMPIVFSKGTEASYLFTIQKINHTLSGISYQNVTLAKFFLVC